MKTVLASKRIHSAVWTGLVGLLLTGAVLSICLAPTEQTMGDAQRVMYVHIAVAWLSLLGFIAMAACALRYLFRRNLWWDQWSQAICEIGWLCSTLTLVTGSLWAHSAWGTWWTWDPRLTISTISWLLYIGYIMLRGAIDNPERQARFGAIYALIAALSIPLNWMAIRWWRTIHPAVVLPGNNADAVGSFGMSASLQTTLLFCLLAFTVFYVALMMHRVKLEAMRRRVDSIRQQVLYR